MQSTLISRPLARRALCGAIVLALWIAQRADAGDWPMWRYDAGRTAASPDPLPPKLILMWSCTFTPRVSVSMIRSTKT